ncbi:S-adenosyl-L-methionine-dependent methyltransferase [Gyrodon lividus]|nr:S-adenosyl-L-methionine-dependent methyltransferase [Gyrodon lividus]
MMSFLRFAHQAVPRSYTVRAFASEALFPAPTASAYQVFDRTVKRKQKDRAVSRNGGEQSRIVDYVRDEVADRMMERLLDIKRKFDTVVDLGSGPGHFSKLLEPDKTRKVLMIDSSKETLNRDLDEEFEVEVERVQADEERLLETLPLNSQEAIVSCLSLHWVNDLPGVLVQIKEALQPDGLFLCAMFGGDTLFELRTALQLAEVDREGGISPHVSPMTDTKDISNLLGRAGFTLLTVDTDEVCVGYPSMWELIKDLQDMGESNSIIGRRHFMHRDTLAAACAIYKELYGNEDSSIPATFQIIYMIGWKPSSAQPKPLERGSAKTSLKDVL